MNENIKPDNLEAQENIIDIFLRLLYLRRRFRGKMPPEMQSLKASIQAHNLRAQIEQVNAHDVFSTIGFVFSRQETPITMGDLSRTLGVPFSTATRTVDWLVESGYVQRLADPEDRRVVRVELTEAGAELYRAMNHILLESAEQLFHNFSSAERQEFGRLLGKLVDSLEQYSG